jgi:hypothetical protein
MKLTKTLPWHRSVTPARSFTGRRLAMSGASAIAALLAASAASAAATAVRRRGEQR